MEAEQQEEEVEEASFHFAFSCMYTTLSEPTTRISFSLGRQFWARSACVRVPLLVSVAFAGGGTVNCVIQYDEL